MLKKEIITRFSLPKSKGRIRLFSMECPAVVSLGIEWVTINNLKRLFLTNIDITNSKEKKI